VQRDGDRIRPAWRRALRDSTLDPTAKVVGFVIETYYDGDLGYAYPSIRTIAAGAGLSVKSRSAVPRAVKKLESAGLLTVRTSNGRHSNRYALVLPSSLQQGWSSLDNFPPSRPQSPSWGAATPLPRGNEIVRVRKEIVETTTSPNQHELSREETLERLKEIRGLLANSSRKASP
jgi:hypothetical protein